MGAPSVQNIDLLSAFATVEAELSPPSDLDQSRLDPQTRAALARSIDEFVMRSVFPAPVHKDQLPAPRGGLFSFIRLEGMT